MIEEARQGNWRMRNLFTAEPQEPFQIRPLWLLVGIAGRFLPSISNVYLMEAARVLTSLSLLMLLAAVAIRFFDSARDRLIAFLVLTFGSGIGWTHLVTDPPDLRIVETSTFLTLVSPPLYSLSLALVIAILLLTERAWNSEKPVRYGILAGLCALWLGFDRPFSLGPLAFAISGLIVVQSIAQKKIVFGKFANLLPLLVGALIPISYQYISIQTNPVYAEWNRQHILPTPPWINLLISLGFLLPLGMVGWKPAFSKNQVFAILAAFYLLASFLFSQLPVGFQERFLEGFPVTTAYFASFGLLRLRNGIVKPVLQTLFATVVIAILMLSHRIPVQNDFNAIARQSPPQYMPDRLLAAMLQLKTLASENEAVLSTEPTGNFLIAYSGRQAVLAQKIQTARYVEKFHLVSEYLSTPADDPRSRDLFLQSHATWLFWGPEEAGRSAGRLDPFRAPYLVEKYKDGALRIFKLK